MTYSSTGETDIWLARASASGNLTWFVTDVEPGMDFSADIIYEDNSEQIYLCGTTDRNNHYDLLVAAYDLHGKQEWLQTRDDNGNAELGAKVSYNGTNLIINGSSQSSSTDWDIVSWEYDVLGHYVGEERSSGLGSGSDELSDGALHNSYISLTGKGYASADSDFKVVCLDASNNLLWQDSYDTNSLDDEGIALVASDNEMAVTGLTTASSGNADIMVRQYNYSGSILWTEVLDHQGTDDKGVDILRDQEDNYMVLAEVSEGGQTDVYLYYLDGSNGDQIWKEMISDNVFKNETPLKLEAGLSGQIFITYEVDGETITKSYNQEEVDYPEDEDLSRGMLYITNGGQLKDTDGNIAEDIKYYSFGHYPDYYFADSWFSALVVLPGEEEEDNDEQQRIDFIFVDAEESFVGQVEEYERETHFNFYTNDEKYELEATFDVLAWPDIYDAVDAFVSSNSAGFKLSFHLEQGADLSNIKLDIDGATGTNINNGKLEIATISEDFGLIEPFSYSPGGEVANDGCVEYGFDSEGHLTLSYTCAGEMPTPYVVHLRSGAGSSYSANSIGNMDWSTFFGGNGKEGCNSVDVDANGNLFVGGYTESSTSFPSGSGVDPNDLKYSPQGLLVKFDHFAEIQWASLIDDPSTAYQSYNIKAIGLYDNLSSWTGQEVHVVGEYIGDLSPSTHCNCSFWGLSTK
ncbi:MAG: hypothetical protein U5L96_13460 [Owenweeksia sp.]|nr:hypothetical protein [Owenweeksia sp.]